MKHPIQWVLFGGGSCMIAGILLLAVGFIFNLPFMEAIATCLLITAVIIAFLPLLTFWIIYIIEKWTGGRR
jgi:fumarate reductase subunit D